MIDTMIDGEDEQTDPVKPQDTNDIPDEFGKRIGESDHDEVKREG